MTKANVITTSIVIVTETFLLLPQKYFVMLAKHHLLRLQNTFLLLVDQIGFVKFT